MLWASLTLLLFSNSDNNSHTIISHCNKVGLLNTMAYRPVYSETLVPVTVTAAESKH